MYTNYAEEKQAAHEAVEAYVGNSQEKLEHLHTILVSIKTAEEVLASTLSIVATSHELSSLTGYKHQTVNFAQQFHHYLIKTYDLLEERRRAEIAESVN